MNKPLYEVADVLHEFREVFQKTYQLPLQHHKVMNAIQACRTSLLGGHKEQCDQCEHFRISYNSCRNRHCPKCQFLKKEQWIEDRKADLLPVKYFHVVFTIPSELNDLAQVNQAIVYNILFKASADILLTLGYDKKHLGASTGAIAVLHTWGQNLMHHPHLHCIVPQGGLAGSRWKYSKYNDFLYPVKVVSHLFRGKFLALLKSVWKERKLKFIGSTAALDQKGKFQQLIDKLYAKDWVVYSKEPFAGPNQVIEYLGRYTHRVAIDNYRIKDIKDGKVSFSYKDYRSGGQKKLMTLEGTEFIRRFLVHVLPKGFCKIRYFGLLSSRQRILGLKICKQIFKVKLERSQKLIARQVIYERTGTDIAVCPSCKEGIMRQVDLEDLIRGSPTEKQLKAA